MKWLIRFFFFAVFIVVLVWAWMNPIKLWFSKPFLEPQISFVKYDSILRISDSLSIEIASLKNIQKKQKYSIQKQERKIDSKIKEYRKKTILVDKIEDCDQIIREYQFIQVQYNDLVITSDSIINAQALELSQKDQIINLKTNQVKEYQQVLASTIQQNKSLKYDLEFNIRKQKNQKRIGYIIIGILALIAIK